MAERIGFQEKLRGILDLAKGQGRCPVRGRGGEIF